MTSAEFEAEGWRLYVQTPPDHDQIVEFARDEKVFRQLPWFGRRADLAPEFNVAGLWWRAIRVDRAKWRVT